MESRVRMTMSGVVRACVWWCGGGGTEGESKLIHGVVEMHGCCRDPARQCCRAERKGKAVGGYCKENEDKAMPRSFTGATVKRVAASIHCS